MEQDVNETVWQDNPSFKELVWCERIFHPGEFLAFVRDASGNKAVLKVSGRSWKMRDMHFNRVICRGNVGFLDGYERARLEAYRSWRTAVGKGLFDLRNEEEIRAQIGKLNEEDRERRRMKDEEEERERERT